MKLSSINKAIGFEDGYDPFKQTTLEPGEYLIFNSDDDGPTILGLEEIKKVTKSKKGDSVVFHTEDKDIKYYLSKWDIREAISFIVK